MKDRHRKLLELLDTHGARLHAVIARLTRREDVVGDLMQELVVRLCQSNGLEKARDPFAYAYRAATHLAFEWRRKQRIGAQSLDQDGAVADENATPLRAVIEEEELARILDATSRLSALARDAVMMRFIEQESYEEIAGRLGKKPQHIRSVVSKALAELRASVVSGRHSEINEG